MEWWNDSIAWFITPDGQAFTYRVLIPVLSVLVAGVVAALIARSAVSSLLAHRDREVRTAAVQTLIAAGEKAAVWNSLTVEQQVLVDQAAAQADVQIRLLPLKGGDVAADWAQMALKEMKRRSATYGYQVAPAVAEFRSRIVYWVRHPRRARKDFTADLEQWRFEFTEAEASVQVKQDAWVAEQHRKQHAAPAVLPADHPSGEVDVTAQIPSRQ